MLRKVELPCALPLLLSGVRSATLQVIATATIAASISLGGLGRYLIDGLGAPRLRRRWPAARSSSPCWPWSLDGVLALVQRGAVSPGLSGRTSGRGCGGPARKDSRSLEVEGDRPPADPAARMTHLTDVT